MNKNAEEHAMKQAGIELIRRAGHEAGLSSTPFVYARSESEFAITLYPSDANRFMQYLPGFTLLYKKVSVLFTVLYVVRPLWSIQIYPKETVKIFTRKSFTGFDKGEIEGMAKRFIAKKHADISLVAYCVSTDNGIFFDPLVSFIPRVPEDYKREDFQKIKVAHTTLTW